MICAALSNSSGFDRWVMSPVWIMKAGFVGSALILAIASRSVPSGIGIGWLVEADMAVADLQEGEAGTPLRPTPHPAVRPNSVPRPIMPTARPYPPKSCIRGHPGDPLPGLLT